MEWSEQLSELPSSWRSDISPELLAASFAPTDTLDRAALSPFIRMQRVTLPCRPAKSSAAGPGAYIVDSYPEFFVRLGWTPVPVLDSIHHMRPPDGPLVQVPPEILIPIPEEECLLDLAYDRAAVGSAWEGTAWHWPAKFTPAAVSRVWEEASLALWDGVDDGRPVGGSFEVGPGWRDESRLATFEIGYFNVWSVQITWHPEPLFTEQFGDGPAEDRRVTFARPSSSNL